MRTIASIQTLDNEAYINLRHRLPTLARALNLSEIVADRIAIVGCDLAQHSESLIVRVDEHNQQWQLMLSVPPQTIIPCHLSLLCDTSARDGHGYHLFYWRLTSPPHLDWNLWRKELEAPSKAALMQQLEKRAIDLDLKNRELEESTRLKSEFLANMSHELRTPMNSIIGFTGRVLKKAADKLDARQLKNLHTVERNAHHLLGLINDLLDISKVEAGRMELYPESVNLLELLHEVRDLTNALWHDKGLEFNMNLPEQSIMLYVDRVRLKQVLINLVSNAVKFTEHGSVTIHAMPSHHANIPTESVTLEVIDTGIGMKANDLAFIFEAFRQADGSNTRAYGGTGLGLNITKNFIELMGGVVEVSSIYGQGSTFSISLPLRQQNDNESVEVLALSSPLVSEHTSGKALVLCIDDNADTLELFQQCLMDDGYQVVCANNGEEGLQQAKVLQPSAIILDVQMPHKDGWSVLKDLKADASTANIPVLMATMMDNKALGMKLGAVDYLEKPIIPEQLLQSIKYARLLNETRDVLVVDDDAGVRELMQQIFEDAHIQVRMAVDGLDGLLKMRQQRPDLIVLDLMMPNMDGFEVIQVMRDDEQLSTIPVIVSTAKTLTREEREWLEQHASQVMLKGGMALNTMVEQALGELKL